jgi:hypothetical protein
VVTGEDEFRNYTLLSPDNDHDRIDSIDTKATSTRFAATSACEIVGHTTTQQLPTTVEGESDSHTDTSVFAVAAVSTSETSAACERNHASSSSAIKSSEIISAVATSSASASSGSGSGSGSGSRVISAISLLEKDGDTTADDNAEDEVDKKELGNFADVFSQVNYFIIAIMVLMMRQFC